MIAWINAFSAASLTMTFPKPFLLRILNILFKNNNKKLYLICHLVLWL